VETITLRKHVGPDGILELLVPLNVQDADVQVTVSYPPKTTDDGDTHRAKEGKAGWPEGYFNRTYGSLAHDPLDREFECEFEVRDEIE
jgi:hypothetical protein